MGGREGRSVGCLRICGGEEAKEGVGRGGRRERGKKGEGRGLTCEHYWQEGVEGRGFWQRSCLQAAAEVIHAGQAGKNGARGGKGVFLANLIADGK